MVIFGGLCLVPLFCHHHFVRSFESKQLKFLRIFFELLRNWRTRLSFDAKKLILINEYESWSSFVELYFQLCAVWTVDVGAEAYKWPSFLSASSSTATKK